MINFNYFFKINFKFFKNNYIFKQYINNFKKNKYK